MKAPPLGREKKKISDVPSHSDKRRRFSGVVSFHHPAGLHRQLVHCLRDQEKKHEYATCVEGAPGAA